MEDAIVSKMTGVLETIIKGNFSKILDKRLAVQNKWNDPTKVAAKSHPK